MPGSFGAQIATKRAPDIAGNVGASPLGRWETKCLEIFGPKLPSKQPLILHVILEPTCLSSFGPLLDRFATTTCGLPLDQNGLVLDLFWSYFGLVLQSFWTCFGPVGSYFDWCWTYFEVILDWF